MAMTKEHRQVNKRADHLGAVVAERVLGVGTAPGDLTRPVGDADRSGVARVVGGVGEERKAAGEEATDDLRDSDSDVEEEGNEQVLSALAFAVMVVVVAHEPRRYL